MTQNTVISTIKKMNFAVYATRFLITRSCISSMHLCHLLKSLCFALSEGFKLCEAEHADFVEYFVIDKHFFEQIFQKVEPKNFLYEFLNSGDQLYYNSYSLLRGSNLHSQQRYSTIDHV